MSANSNAAAEDPLFSLQELQEFLEASMEDSDVASGFVLGEDWDKAVASVFFVKGGAAAREVYCLLVDLGYLTPGKPVSAGLGNSATDALGSEVLSNSAAGLDIMLASPVALGLLPPAVARWMCHLFRRAVMKHDAALSERLDFSRVEGAIESVARGRKDGGFVVENPTPAPEGYPPMRVEDAPSRTSARQGSDQIGGA